MELRHFYKGEYTNFDMAPVIAVYQTDEDGLAYSYKETQITKAKDGQRQEDGSKLIVLTDEDFNTLKTGTPLQQQMHLSGLWQQTE
jgi:hypothetical protein